MIVLLLSMMMAFSVMGCSDGSSSDDGSDEDTAVYTVAIFSDGSRRITFRSDSTFDYYDGVSGTYTGYVLLDNQITLKLNDGRTLYASTGAVLKVFSNAARSGSSESFNRSLDGSEVTAIYRYDYHDFDYLLKSGECIYYLYYFCSDGSFVYKATSNSKEFMSAFGLPSGAEIAMAKGTYSGTAGTTDITLNRSYVNVGKSYPEKWGSNGFEYTYNLQSNGTYTTTSERDFTPLYKWQN